MTLTTTTNIARSTGDGESAEFVVPFKFFRNEDLQVYVSDADGNDGAALLLDTDYTVAGAGDADGGTVTFSVAPPVGRTVTRERVVVPLQDARYVENAGFPSEDHERILDRLAASIQDMQGTMVRTILFPRSDNTPFAPLPGKEYRKGRALMFDPETGAPTLTSDLYVDQTAAAEQAAIAAKGYRDEAGGIKSATEGIRDEAAGYRDQASSIRDETAGIRDATSGIRDATGGIKTETEGVRDEVADMRDEVLAATAVFATRAAAEAASYATPPDYLRVIAYDDDDMASGPVGGALFRRAETEPAHPGKLQTGDGAWYEIATEFVTPEMFGAKRNGVDYDNEAIQNAALVQQAVASVSEVRLGRGTYLLNTSSSNGLRFDGTSGLRMVGAGRGRTILKIDDDTGGHTLHITNAVDTYISDFTLDGNRDNNSATGHGIRLGSVSGFVGERVDTRNSQSYGIGAQSGEIKDVRLSDVRVVGCGSDGIDFKNTVNLNDNLIMDQIYVAEWGLNNVGSRDAGIDLRGPWQCSNIIIRGPGRDAATAFRFRTGEAEDGNGLGGHRSSLVNFDFNLGGAAEGVAIDVGARDVVIANGNMRGGQYGVRALASDMAGDDRLSLANVIAKDVSAHGFAISGNGARLTNCSAVNCGQRGLYLLGNRATVVAFEGDGCAESIRVQGNDNTVIGFKSRNSTQRALQMLAGAERTIIIGGRVGENESTVADNGTDTVIRDLSGYRTSNKGSAEITSGNTSVTVTHGLNVAPAAGDILATVTSAWGAAAKCWVSDVTSTNFKINVDADPAATVSFNWWAKVKGAA